MSGTSVRAVEGRDSFGYPGEGASAEKGPSRLRVHKSVFLCGRCADLVR